MKISPSPPKKKKFYFPDKSSNFRVNGEHSNYSGNFMKSKHKHSLICTLIVLLLLPHHEGILSNPIKKFCSLFKKKSPSPKSTKGLLNSLDLSMFCDEECHSSLYRPFEMQKNSNCFPFVWKSHASLAREITFSRWKCLTGCFPLPKPLILPYNSIGTFYLLEDNKFYVRFFKT